MAEAEAAKRMAEAEAAKRMAEAEDIGGSLNNLLNYCY